MTFRDELPYHEGGTELDAFMLRTSGVQVTDAYTQSDDERRRDAQQVQMANQYNARFPHDALVSFGPDDSHDAQQDQQDEEALWTARLAAPDVAEDA